MKLKGSLTTPTCGRFYGKKLNLVVLSQLVGFFNSLHMNKQNNFAHSIRYKNLEPSTYRYGAVLGKTNFHVDIRERRESDESPCKDI